MRKGHLQIIEKAKENEVKKHDILRDCLRD